MNRCGRCKHWEGSKRAPSMGLCHRAVGGAFFRWADEGAECGVFTLIGTESPLEDRVKELEAENAKLRMKAAEHEIAITRLSLYYWGARIANAEAAGGGPEAAWDAMSADHDLAVYTEDLIDGIEMDYGDSNADNAQLRTKLDEMRQRWVDMKAALAEEAVR